MILTLCHLKETLRLEITHENFKRLRSSDITSDEIDSIAAASHIDPQILKDYVSDLSKEIQDEIEIDGSCEYTDHF